MDPSTVWDTTQEMNPPSGSTKVPPLPRGWNAYWPTKWVKTPCLVIAGHDEDWKGTLEGLCWLLWSTQAYGGRYLPKGTLCQKSKDAWQTCGGTSLWTSFIRVMKGLPPACEFYAKTFVEWSIWVPRQANTDIGNGNRTGCSNLRRERSGGAFPSTVESVGDHLAYQQTSRSCSQEVT